MKHILLFLIFSTSLLLSSCKKEEVRFATSPLHVVNSQSSMAKGTMDNGVIFLSINPLSWKLMRLSSEGSVDFSIELIQLKQQFPDLSLQCFTPTPDGGCVIGAEYYLDTATYYKSAGLLIKFDPSGQQSWISTYDTFQVAGSRRLDDITVGIDGNLIVVEKNSTSSSEYRLLRFSDSGSLQHNSKLNLNASCKKILSLPEGDLILLTDNEFISELTRVDSLGNIIWTSSLSESDPYDNIITSPTDVAVNSSGKVLVSGFTNSWNGEDNKNFDFFLLTIDASGVVLDSITWEGYANEYCQACRISQDGSVYLIGTTCSLPANIAFGESLFDLTSLARCYLLKLDPTLRLSWKKTFGNSYGSEGIIVTERADGKLLVCGNQIGFGNKNEINLFSQIILPNGE